MKEVFISDCDVSGKPVCHYCGYCGKMMSKYNNMRHSAKCGKKRGLYNT